MAENTGNVLEIEVLTPSGKKIGSVPVPKDAIIKDLKQSISNAFKIAVNRQSIRTAPKGKDQTDSLPISKLNFDVSNRVYCKDLGPQIGWDTVFYLEYAGPIFLYGALLIYPQCFYSRDSIVKGKGQDTSELFPFNIFPVPQINYFCGGGITKVQVTAILSGILWTIHYVKRILETAFVHRFSHGTMPIFNLFKNCGYYWGFALYVAYHINHPLHTPPPLIFQILGTLIFILSEIGNLSVHILLRDLRPEGTTVRKIPFPNANPFTKLFNFVSCPNYTYEFGAWVGFTILSGCLPVFIFAIAGLYQMTVWAIGKHKKYRTEFKDYPKQRKAILPYII